MTTYNPISDLVPEILDRLQDHLNAYNIEYDMPLPDVIVTFTSLEDVIG